MLTSDCDALAALFEGPAEVPPLAAAFARAIAALDPRHLAEVHAATFELAPSCVPYAGEHLFGEGSQRRGPLLVGLAEACQRAGVAHEGELPDHVSVLLRLLPRLPDEEATELASLCLSPLLDGMAAALEQTDNPYRHLVAATRAWLSAEVLRA